MLVICLCVIVVGMAWRFTEALTKGEWLPMAWYGIEILALGLFLKGLMI